MLDLASALGDLPEKRGLAPWPDHEYVKGWGVFGLPFDSGHVLALRVFPQSDFGPYRTVWHRDPAGDWSIYVDGPRLDTACPRYYGAACAHTGFSHIELAWTGQASLHVRVDRPLLDLTLTASDTPTLRLLNAVGAHLPVWTWKPRAFVRTREWMAHRLGMGDLEMSGTMPSGHVGTLMPQRMFFVEEATATLEGADLGRPTLAKPNPMIGDVPLPARGVLAIGQAMWRILDHAEYDRTLKETRVLAALEEDGPSETGR
jgi:hypothetical protein